MGKTKWLSEMLERRTVLWGKKCTTTVSSSSSTARTITEHLLHGMKKNPEIHQHYYTSYYSWYKS